MTTNDFFNSMSASERNAAAIGSFSTEAKKAAKKHKINLDEVVNIAAQAKRQAAQVQQDTTKADTELTRGRTVAEIYELLNLYEIDQLLEGTLDNELAAKLGHKVEALAQYAKAVAEFQTSQAHQAPSETDDDDEFFEDLDDEEEEFYDVEEAEEVVFGDMTGQDLAQTVANMLGDHHAQEAAKDAETVVFEIVQEEQKPTKEQEQVQEPTAPQAFTPDQLAAIAAAIAQQPQHKQATKKTAAERMKAVEDLRKLSEKYEFAADKLKEVQAFKKAVNTSHCSVKFYATGIDSKPLETTKTAVFLACLDILERETLAYMQAVESEIEALEI